MDNNEIDYFIWNGINTNDMDCEVYELPPIEGTQKNYKYQNIGGRIVTIDEGDYQTRAKQAKLYYLGSNIDQVSRWLSGTGKVTFSNQPDRYFKAFINNKIPFNELIENEVRDLVIQFECEPFGYLNSGREVRVETIANIELTNPGNVEAEPVVTVYGSGDIDLVIAQQVIKLKGVNEYITLDTPLLEAYKDKELQNSKVNGEFPIFPTGTFAFRWNGSVTKVEIIPNWRCS